MTGKPLHSLFFPLPPPRRPTLWAQGPPYQTDDPVPVDLHHYEFYIFGGADGTPAEWTRPAPPSNSTGAPSRACSSTPSCPRAPSSPRIIPPTFPAGTGPRAFGLTDMELGVKIAFIKETKHLPQIGTFTMFEMPTGNARQRPGRRQSLVQAPRLVPEKLRQMALRRRRRLPGCPANRLPQLPLHRMAGQKGAKREAGAGSRALRSWARRASPRPRRRLPP